MFKYISLWEENMKFYDLEITVCDDDNIMLEQEFDTNMDKARIVITKVQANIVAEELLRIANTKSSEA
jgi:hypothetical protein